MKNNFNHRSKKFKYRHTITKKEDPKRVARVSLKDKLAYYLPENK